MALAPQCAMPRLAGLLLPLDAGAVARRARTLLALHGARKERPLSQVPDVRTRVAAAVAPRDTAATGALTAAMAFRSFQTRIVVSFLVLIDARAGGLVPRRRFRDHAERAHPRQGAAGTAARVFSPGDRRPEPPPHRGGAHPVRGLPVQAGRGSSRSRDPPVGDGQPPEAASGPTSMMMVSLDNTLVADTAHRQARGAGRAALVGFSSLAAQAEQRGEATTFVVIDERLYQLVVVPLRAPAPVAWIGMGFLIDHRLAEELEQTTSSHVSFVQARPANVWTAFTSTLPPSAQRSLVESLEPARVRRSGAPRLRAAGPRVRDPRHAAPVVDAGRHPRHAASLARRRDGAVPGAPGRAPPPLGAGRRRVRRRRGLGRARRQPSRPRARSPPPEESRRATTARSCRCVSATRSATWPRPSIG